MATGLVAPGSKRTGPVKADKDPYTWKSVFRARITQHFDGQKPSSDEIKAAVPEVSTATTTALGYSLEEAQKDDLNEMAMQEVKWARTGEEELANTSPGDM